MRAKEITSYKLHNYRVEDPFYTPVDDSKQRHKESETRSKNRRNRKRLKNSKR